MKELNIVAEKGGNGMSSISKAVGGEIEFTEPHTPPSQIGALFAWAFESLEDARFRFTTVERLLLLTLVSRCDEQLVADGDLGVLAICCATTEAEIDNAINHLVRCDLITLADGGFVTFVHLSDDAWHAVYPGVDRVAA